MCRCGGASEHEHLSGTVVKFTKSLHSFLVPERISAINVKNPGVCAEQVFREHFFPIEGQECLVSDADDQIIIIVPFVGTVKLKSMEIFGSPNNPSSWPAKVKVFVNAPNLDFTNVDSLSPTQEFDLSECKDGPVQYNFRAAKFFNVNSIALFFEKSHGHSSTEINFIGFQGEFSQNRVGAVNAAYEIKPQLSDHKTADLFAAASKPGF